MVNLVNSEQIYTLMLINEIEDLYPTPVEKTTPIRVRQPKEMVQIKSSF